MECVSGSVLPLHCNAEVILLFSIRMNLQWIKLFKLSSWRVKMHTVISQHQLCCWVTFHENTLLCKIVNKIELNTHLAAKGCCSDSASQASQASPLKVLQILTLTHNYMYFLLVIISVKYILFAIIVGVFFNGNTILAFHLDEHLWFLLLTFRYPYKKNLKDSSLILVQERLFLQFFNSGCNIK